MLNISIFIFSLHRTPDCPPLWKPKATTPITCRRQHVRAATSCCPISAALSVAPPWGTSWETSCASSTLCDAAARPTSAVASPHRPCPLNHPPKRSTEPPPRPPFQLGPSGTLSRSHQSCSFPLSPASGPQTSVPGINMDKIWISLLKTQTHYFSNPTTMCSQCFYDSEHCKTQLLGQSYIPFKLSTFQKQVHLNCT